MHGLLGSPRLNQAPPRAPFYRAITTFCILSAVVLSLLYLSQPQRFHPPSSLTFGFNHAGQDEGVVTEASVEAQPSLPAEPALTKISFGANVAPQDEEPPTSPSPSPYPALASPSPLATPSPYPPLAMADTAERVAFCMVIKNQSIDMPEFFIHHYYHHGVRRFYIYDDGSEPPLSEKPYVDSWGIPDEAITFKYVHPEDVKDRHEFQVDTYTDCIKRFGSKHEWVALLDPDEFLEMRGKEPVSLLEWLGHWDKNKTVGALGVHWLGHNSDGHLKKQPGDVRKAFKSCVGNAPDKSNRHVKTFVKPKYFDMIENIHWTKTKNGTIEVAEHGDRINTWCHTPITHDIWALHHYATKSREDYELKKSRHR